MASKHYLLQIDRANDSIDINHDITDKIALSIIPVCSSGKNLRRTHIIKGKNKLQWKKFFPLALDDDQN